MKKVLILSYNALPMDVVSSYRAKGYCDHLSKYNYYPTLITHRWEKNDDGDWALHDDGQIQRERFSTHSIIRLPRKKNTQRKLFGRIYTLKNFIYGDFEAELYESYLIFKSFLNDHLKNNAYDLILAIYGPHFQLKLAFELHDLFKIPYVLDFRDLWDNQVVTKSYNPSLRKILIDYFVKRHWKKWLGKSIFFTTTSDLWKIYLQNLSGKTGLVVRNGYDHEIIWPSATTPQEVFKIVHFGRFYPSQNLTTFFDGYKLFLERCKQHTVLLEIIGVKRKYGVDILSYIAELPEHSWQIKEYMPKQQLLAYCHKEATIFWIPGFTEDNGQFVVKMYDYLILNKPILMAPGDESNIQHVIEYIQAGSVAHTKEQVCKILSDYYSEFVAKGTITGRSDHKKILEFSREKQVKVLSEKINEFVK